MTEEEAKDILFKIKKDNESKAMIIHNNSSNIQISWSNEDLKDMARIQQRCANNVRAIDIILNELDSKDTEINKLKKEKEYYKKLYNESYNFLDPKFTGDHIPRID